MTNRFLSVMATVALGAGMACAGEEYMPLMPGPDAYAHNEVGGATNVSATRRVASNDPDGGRQRPQMRQNVVRLTLPPAPVKQPSRLKMVEATESGPDGTLTFQPTQTMPGTRHADIPGLVPPEVLALSHIQQINNSGGRSQAPAPIRLPQTLGTEELGEFDPTAVSRTGDPFRDTPGFAEVFPAATTRSQAMGTRTLRTENNRPRSAQSAPATFDAYDVPNRHASRAAAGRDFPAAAPTQQKDSLRPHAPSGAPQPIQLPAPLETPHTAKMSSLFELPLPEALQPMQDGEEPAAAPVSAKQPFMPPPLETPQASMQADWFDDEPQAALQPNAAVQLPEDLPPAQAMTPFQTLEPLETLPLPRLEDGEEIVFAGIPSVHEETIMLSEPPGRAYAPPPPAPLPELPMPKVSSPLPRPMERSLRPSQSPSRVAPPPETAPTRGRLDITSAGSMLPPPVDAQPAEAKREPSKGLSLRPPPRLENEEPVPLMPLTQSQGIILHPGERVVQPPGYSITGNLTDSMPLTASYPAGPDPGLSVTGPPPSEEYSPGRRKTQSQGSLSESVAVKKADALTPMRGLKIY